jgi:hypothetical protein
MQLCHYEAKNSFCFASGLLNKVTRLRASWWEIWIRVPKVGDLSSHHLFMVKFSSPNVPSTWLIIFCPPYSCLPTEIASFLLLAYSLFALVAAFSQCWCSESPYLLTKLYRIYVCYMNIKLYIAFDIIRGFTLPHYVLERTTREYGGTPVLLFWTWDSTLS